FLGLFHDARWHDGHDGKVEFVEDVRFARKLGDEVLDVQAIADRQGADVRLYVVGDEARQYRDLDFAALNVEHATFAHAGGRADELDGNVHFEGAVGGDG